MNITYEYFIDSNHKLEDLNETTNGFGKLFVSNENYSYTYNGYIKDGKMNGTGFIIYKYNKLDPTIEKYQGELLNNQYDGQGKITYSNGDIFVGNFKENIKHGNGKLYDHTGNIIYDHNFINGNSYHKIKYTKNYIGSTILQYQGYMIDSIKVGTWIYYREDNIVDKIEFYKNYETNDTNIVEILEQIINTNKTGYIVSQKLNILSPISNDQLINVHNYCKEILTASYVESNISYLKDIAIILNPKIDEAIYYLQLTDNRKIHLISYSNPQLINLIIWLPNNKFLIRNNDQMSIYKIINHKLSLFYEGSLNKNNIPNGEGIIYENGKITFKGIFKNGQLISGLKFSDESPQYIQYNGTFKNNIPDGIGIFYNKDNIKIYEGMISNDKYHGDGILYWETTGLKKWEGKMYMGFKHGNGYLYDENEVLICSCSFEYDNMININ
jgi:hypothetical protein